MKIILNNVRLAFPNLFQPKAFNDEGEPKYGAVFLFPIEHHASQDIRKGLEIVATEKWGAKGLTVLNSLKASLKLCLHAGDEKPDYEGFPGNLYISTSGKKRPLVLDRDKTPLAESDGRIYPGCYVNASIDLWAMDNNFGKRINASLNGVQFLNDGPSFLGENSSGMDDFSPVPVDGTTKELAPLDDDIPW